VKTLFSFSDFGSDNLSQKALLGTQNELILYTENPRREERVLIL
jgi:hypothetical protein